MDWLNENNEQLKSKSFLKRTQRGWNMVELMLKTFSAVVHSTNI